MCGFFHLSLSCGLAMVFRRGTRCGNLDDALFLGQSRVAAQSTAQVQRASKRNNRTAVISCQAYVPPSGQLREERLERQKRENRIEREWDRENGIERMGETDSERMGERER